MAETNLRTLSVTESTMMETEQLGVKREEEEKSETTTHRDRNTARGQTQHPRPPGSVGLACFRFRLVSRVAPCRLSGTGVSTASKSSDRLDAVGALEGSFYSARHLSVSHKRVDRQ